MHGSVSPESCDGGALRAGFPRVLVRALRHLQPRGKGVRTGSQDPLKTSSRPRPALLNARGGAAFSSGMSL